MLGLMDSTRPRVAIAVCRAFDGAEATDVYPDPDWPLLSAARQAKLAQLIGLERSPLGPTALALAQARG